MYDVVSSKLNVIKPLLGIYCFHTSSVKEESVCFSHLISVQFSHLKEEECASSHLMRFSSYVFLENGLCCPPSELCAV